MVVTNALFEPFCLKSLTLPNRVVMAPMTRYFSPNGVPAEGVADYYRRRAEGGVGLIITEGVGIDRPAARNNPNVPVLIGQEAIAGWTDIVSQVHAAGGRIAPQLWHVGAAPDPMKNGVPHPAESPSGLFSPEIRVGNAMSLSEIEAVQAAFVRSAVEAKRIGFDCIELHGAHGYLIDQFFWPSTNRRTDRFGSNSMEDRIRFVAETVRAIRSAVGSRWVLIMRISQWKEQDYTARIAATALELEHWLKPLAEAGIDIFHCSQRRFWEPEFAGSPLNFAGWVKKVTGCATITVGSVGLSSDLLAPVEGEVKVSTASLNHLLERLESGEFDLVAVGRALLSDPEWLAKTRDGRTHELVPYDAAHFAKLY
jgi:2,4-dienoyl-CoA reductase-like NADH-dependent reductase (Old Yellow Enzyme family)